MVESPPLEQLMPTPVFACNFYMKQVRGIACNTRNFKIIIFALHANMDC